MRSLELLAHDEPYRVRDGAAVPSGIPVVLMVLQLLVVLLAAVGAVVLVRARAGAAIPLVAAVGFVWMLSFPFQTEARYALPVRPLLIILAVAGATALRPRQAGDEPLRA